MCRVSLKELLGLNHTRTEGQQSSEERGPASRIGARAMSPRYVCTHLGCHPHRPSLHILYLTLSHVQIFMYALTCVTYVHYCVSLFVYRNRLLQFNGECAFIHVHALIVIAISSGDQRMQCTSASYSVILADFPPPLPCSPPPGSTLASWLPTFSVDLHSTDMVWMQEAEELHQSVSLQETNKRFVCGVVW